LTPGARIAAAIDILAAIEPGERPADDIAAEYLRRRRYIGAKDRAAVSGHVYAVLRHRAVLDWWIARSSQGEVAPAARSRMIAAALLIDKWSAQDIAASFDGDRFRPTPLLPAEERLARGLAGRTLTHPAMSRAVASDLPDWLLPYLDAVYGRRLEDEMAALNAPAPLDLRVNSLKTDRDGARRALAAEEIIAEPTPWSPLGLRLKYRAPLSGTAAFKEGLVEVQDEGSQVAALLADARPGMRVVDFCAGANARGSACAAPGSAMSSAGRWRASATSGSSAMPPASTGCWSMRPVSASAAGAATRTANGAPPPTISPSSSCASATSSRARRGWCGRAAD